MRRKQSGTGAREGAGSRSTGVTAGVAAGRTSCAGIVSADAAGGVPTARARHHALEVADGAGAGASGEVPRRAGAWPCAAPGVIRARGTELSASSSTSASRRRALSSRLYRCFPSESSSSYEAHPSTVHVVPAGSAARRARKASSPSGGAPPHPVRLLAGAVCRLSRTAAHVATLSCARGRSNSM
jgi:hypothetical protein